MGLDDITLRENAELKLTDLVPFYGWYKYGSRNNDNEAICARHFKGELAKKTLREEQFLGWLNCVYAISLTALGGEWYYRFFQ